MYYISQEKSLADRDQVAILHSEVAAFQKQLELPDGIALSDWIAIGRQLTRLSDSSLISGVLGRVSLA